MEAHFFMLFLGRIDAHILGQGGPSDGASPRVFASVK